MSRVLLIGYNPPALKTQARIEAAHYRTWQCLQPVLADGHTVCLCADTANTDRAAAASFENGPGQLVYHPITFRRYGWTAKLQEAHDTFRPDCIVAVNFAPCLYATRLRTDKPMWMDIYGDYLTIIQVAGYRARSDRGLPTSIAFVKQVLEKGDVFSACSTPQQHMLVGELAMTGRLNWRTFGYQFVQTILPGAPTVEAQSMEKTRLALTQHGVQAEDFVVLWCGGYNTWTDVETLFAALEWAMSQEPRLHYVSVGASTYGATGNVYNQLVKAIDQSRYRERFHMLGWRPWAEIADYYRESDAGVNIDALHYETIYGTRTRLLEMMAAGLPIVTSLGCELSYLLRDRGTGLTFEPGDWQSLGRQLVTLAQDHDRCSALGQAALDHARHELSFSTTTQSLRAWVKSPQRAPDKGHSGLRERRLNLEHRTRALIRQFLWKAAGLDK